MCLTDFNDIWKTSASGIVNFSDFPTFDPNRGKVGSTIILVLSKHGPVLYAVPHFLRSVRKLRFFPVCAAASQQQLTSGKFELNKKLSSFSKEWKNHYSYFSQSMMPKIKV